jgi:hypothetical protein
MKPQHQQSCHDISTPYLFKISFSIRLPLVQKCPKCYIFNAIFQPHFNVNLQYWNHLLRFFGCYDVMLRYLVTAISTSKPKYFFLVPRHIFVLSTDHMLRTSQVMLILIMLHLININFPRTLMSCRCASLYHWVVPKISFLDSLSYNFQSNTLSQTNTTQDIIARKLTCQLVEQQSLWLPLTFKAQWQQHVPRTLTFDNSWVFTQECIYGIWMIPRIKSAVISLNSINPFIFVVKMCYTILSEVQFSSAPQGSVCTYPPTTPPS